MSRLHLDRLGALLCGLVPALLLAACGEEPAPPRLTGLTPAVLSVPANETLEISVAYEEHDAQIDDFQWRVEAGAIEGNGAPTITYHAPGQPGAYGITVTATHGDEATELSLDSTITVTQPITTEPPAVAAADDDATSAAATPSSAGEPAAAAATTGPPEQAPPTTAFFMPRPLTPGPRPPGIYEHQQVGERTRLPP